MRTKLQWKKRALGASPLLLLSVTAWAEPPAPPGERAWDDRHMQSNFARRLGERSVPGVIVGTNRFEELSGQAIATPPTRVQEQILSINPHGWKPGGPSFGGGSTPRWAASRSSSGASGAYPSRSSGLRNRGSGSRHRTSF
jgi:hypothetical protein